MFMLTILFPAIGNCAGLDPEKIAEVASTNVYAGLVYALGSMLAVCMSALAWIYNSNLGQVKEQFVILKSLSDNIANQNANMEKNQEILEKSLDTVNTKLADKPCLLNNSLVLDLLKKK